MTRRCSHCSHNGHNSRTCPNRGVKLFGVRLTDGSIRKSASMGNLSHYMAGGGGGNGGAHGDSPADTPDHPSADGYASEDFVAGSSSSRERKKGVPWTEEEHRMFLLGLQKLGKGDWRGIARNYVISRTPTQVASHAQKYFIRQNNVSRRKRRSSLFDIVADQQAGCSDIFSLNPEAETSSIPEAAPPSVDEEYESMESANSNDGEAEVAHAHAQYPPYQVLYPAAYVAAPFFQVSVPFWYNANAEHPVKEEEEETHHQVVKPTPLVHSKSSINVDELVGMSKLSIGGDSLGDSASGPSALSLKLVEGASTRPSAFHANPTSRNSGMKSSHSQIHAV